MPLATREIVVCATASAGCSWRPSLVVRSARVDSYRLAIGVDSGHEPVDRRP